MTGIGIRIGRRREKGTGTGTGRAPGKGENGSGAHEGGIVFRGWMSMVEFDVGLGGLEFDKGRRVRGVLDRRTKIPHGDEKITRGWMKREQGVAVSQEQMCSKGEETFQTRKIFS